jgi:hypothetical protein
VGQITRMKSFRQMVRRKVSGQATAFVGNDVLDKSRFWEEGRG